MNGQKVPVDKLDYILNAIRLSPSSLGLQPYTILVMSDKEVRNEIYEKACQQSQILEGSHVLVFAAHVGLSNDTIKKFIELISSERKVATDSMEEFRSKLTSFAQEKQQNDVDYLNWAARQAYIALGIGLVAAAEQNVDATPMEGFDPEILDEVLGIKKKGLRSVVLMTLGYRDKDHDHLVNLKKVRKPLDELFVTL